MKSPCVTQIHVVSKSVLLLSTVLVDHLVLPFTVSCYNYITASIHVHYCTHARTCIYMYMCMHMMKWMYTSAGLSKAGALSSPNNTQSINALTESLRKLHNCSMSRGQKVICRKFHMYIPDNTPSLPHFTQYVKSYYPC